MLLTMPYELSDFICAICQPPMILMLISLVGVVPAYCVYLLRHDDTKKYHDERCVLIGSCIGSVITAVVIFAGTVAHYRCIRIMDVANHYWLSGDWITAYETYEIISDYEPAANAMECICKLYTRQKVDELWESGDLLNAPYDESIPYCNSEKLLQVIIEKCLDESKEY